MVEAAEATEEVVELEVVEEVVEEVVVEEVEEEVGEALVEVTWVDDPTAMPRESSILFFHAKMIAAACSAALPTIGMTMVPRKRLGTWLGSGLGLASPNPNPNPHPNQEEVGHPPVRGRPLERIHHELAQERDEYLRPG